MHTHTHTHIYIPDDKYLKSATSYGGPRRAKREARAAISGTENCSESWSCCRVPY